MSKKFLTPVQLPADPTNPLEAVTKQYVDARAGSEIEISTADPIGTNPSAELWYDSDDPGGGVVTTAFDGTPSPVDLVGSPGTLNNWARGDHVHAAQAYTPYNGTPTQIGAPATGGVVTSWARGDHAHPMPPLAGRRLNDNGQLTVKQRLATTVAVVGSTILADRWTVSNSGVGTANLVYSTPAAGGFPPLPAGRPIPANIQYLQMSAAEAAGSLAAGDWMQWAQSMEGINLQHFNWGTAGALPVTYSFDIYSGVATTYVVELLRNETTQRSISKLLPVPQGFSTQVVTFPGDTTTPITNDTTWRLQANVAIGAGSTYTSGTLQTTWGNIVSANRWAGLSNAFAATVNNVFAITNAQLEIGSVATPYEVGRYDDELRHCMRYYRQTDRAAGLHGEGGLYGYNAAGQLCLFNTPFPVPMRAAPVMAVVGTFFVTNCAQPYLNTASPYSYSMYYAVTATGPFSAYSNNNGYFTFNTEI